MMAAIERRTLLKSILRLLIEDMRLAGDDAQ